MNELGFKNIGISLAIILPIGIVGLFVLRDDQVAKGMMVVALVSLGCIFLQVLDARQRRRRRRVAAPR